MSGVFVNVVCVCGGSVCVVDVVCVCVCSECLLMQCVFDYVACAC